MPKGITDIRLRWNTADKAKTAQYKNRTATVTKDRRTFQIEIREKNKVIFTHQSPSQSYALRLARSVLIHGTR